MRAFLSFAGGVIAGIVLTVAWALLTYEEPVFSAYADLVQGRKWPDASQNRRP